MTGPVVYGDDERDLITYLVAAYDSRDETYVPGAGEVSPQFPSETLNGDATHVQVQHDTTRDLFPAAREKPQTRVTCWAAADRRTALKQLATLTAGLLEQRPNVRPVIGRSSVGTDPDTKNIFVWFLIESDLRGVLLDA